MKISSVNENIGLTSMQLFKGSTRKNISKIRIKVRILNLNLPLTEGTQYVFQDAGIVIFWSQESGSGKFLRAVFGYWQHPQAGFC